MTPEERVLLNELLAAKRENQQYKAAEARKDHVAQRWFWIGSTWWLVSVVIVGHWHGHVRASLLEATDIAQVFLVPPLVVLIVIRVWAAVLKRRRTKRAASDA